VQPKRLGPGNKGYFYYNEKLANETITYARIYNASISNMAKIEGLLSLQPSRTNLATKQKCSL
jgi:hypothetical protein